MAAPSSAPCYARVPTAAPTSSSSASTRSRRGRRQTSASRGCSRASAGPCASSLHGDEGFGGFQARLDAARRARAARGPRAAAASLVDVDLRFAEALGDLGGPRIQRATTWRRTPRPAARAGARGRSARADPGDLVKLVPAARAGARRALTVLTRSPRPKGGAPPSRGRGRAFRDARAGSASALDYAAAHASIGRAGNRGCSRRPAGILAGARAQAWQRARPAPPGGCAAVCGSPIG